MEVFHILNLSPDSFSDGDQALLDPKNSLDKAKVLIAKGTDYIDLGAESTRPGAVVLDPELEWQRLKSFLEVYDLSTPLSLDSRNASVIARALELNPKIACINDVSGLQNLEVLKVVSNFCVNDLKYIAMHSFGGVPPRLNSAEIPDDFYKEHGGLEDHMKRFFSKTISCFQDYALNLDNLILDPGLGFGKNLRHSFEILEIIPKLKKEFGLKVLLGPSRKGFLKLWKNNPQASLEELDQYTVEFVKLAKDINFIRIH